MMLMSLYFVCIRSDDKPIAKGMKDLKEYPNWHLTPLFEFILFGVKSLARTLYGFRDQGMRCPIRSISGDIIWPCLFSITPEIFCSLCGRFSDRFGLVMKALPIF